MHHITGLIFGIVASILYLFCCETPRSTIDLEEVVAYYDDTDVVEYQMYTHTSGGVAFIRDGQKRPSEQQYRYYKTVYLPLSFSDFLVDWNFPNEFNSPYIEVDPPREGNELG